MTAGDDYLLPVYLDNGHSLLVDMKKKLFTARFSELRDKQVFTATRTDGKVIYWPEGPSLTIGELVELVAK